MEAVDTAAAASISIISLPLPSDSDVLVKPGNCSSSSGDSEVRSDMQLRINFEREPSISKEESMKKEDNETDMQNTVINNQLDKTAKMEVTDVERCSEALSKSDSSNDNVARGPRQGSYLPASPESSCNSSYDNCIIGTQTYISPNDPFGIEFKLSKSSTDGSDDKDNAYVQYKDQDRHGSSYSSAAATGPGPANPLFIDSDAATSVPASYTFSKGEGISSATSSASLSPPSSLPENQGDFSQREAHRPISLNLSYDGIQSIAAQLPESQLSSPSVSPVLRSSIHRTDETDRGQRYLLSSTPLSHSGSRCTRSVSQQTSPGTLYAPRSYSLTRASTSAELTINTPMLIPSNSSSKTKMYSADEIVDKIEAVESNLKSRLADVNTFLNTMASSVDDKMYRLHGNFRTTYVAVKELQDSFNELRNEEVVPKASRDDVEALNVTIRKLSTDVTQMVNDLQGGILRVRLEDVVEKGLDTMYRSIAAIRKIMDDNFPFRPFLAFSRLDPKDERALIERIRTEVKDVVRSELEKQRVDQPQQPFNTTSSVSTSTTKGTTQLLPAPTQASGKSSETPSADESGTSQKVMIAMSNDGGAGAELEPETDSSSPVIEGRGHRKKKKTGRMPLELFNQIVNGIHHTPPTSSSSSLVVKPTTRASSATTTSTTQSDDSDFQHAVVRSSRRRAIVPYRYSVNTTANPSLRGSPSLQVQPRPRKSCEDVKRTATKEQLKRKLSTIASGDDESAECSSSSEPANVRNNKGRSGFTAAKVFKPRIDIDAALTVQQCKDVQGIRKVPNLICSSSKKGMLTFKCGFVDEALDSSQNPHFACNFQTNFFSSFIKHRVDIKSRCDTIVGSATESSGSVSNKGKTRARNSRANVCPKLNLEGKPCQYVIQKSGNQLRRWLIQHDHDVLHQDDVMLQNYCCIPCGSMFLCKTGFWSHLLRSTCRDATACGLEDETKADLAGREHLDRLIQIIQQG